MEAAEASGYDVKKAILLNTCGCWNILDIAPKEADVDGGGPYDIRGWIPIGLPACSVTRYLVPPPPCDVSRTRAATFLSLCRETLLVWNKQFLEVGGTTN